MQRTAQPLILAVVSSLVCLLAFGAMPAAACTAPQPTPPPPVVSPPTQFGTLVTPEGERLTVLSIEIDLFAPPAPTTCVCGLGLRPPADPVLPPSLEVTRALVTRFNRQTGQHTVLHEFEPLAPNAITTAAFGGAAGPSTGQTWFGFSGLIDPFTAPVLDPEREAFALSFVLDVDPAELPDLPGIEVEFAAGEGDALGVPLFDDPLHPALFFGDGVLPPCIPTDEALCLNDGRFRVEVDWKTPFGEAGPGKVGPCPTDDSGLFFFFEPENVEMQVKVLDACVPPFNTFWVFAAATTNVEYTLTVTDTVSGLQKQYFNPQGRPALTITDTSAFATCP